MRDDQRLCFKVKVPTTNAMGDAFNLNGTYYDCDGGEIYVFAESIAHAARQIPNAEKIEYVGFGLVSVVHS